MKKIVCLIILTITSFCFETQAQSSKNVKIKLIEKIVGSWQIAEVTEGKTKLADKPTGVSAMEFSPDGKFKSFSKAVAIDSGSYRINEGLSVLYLESSDNKENPSEWKISIKDDKMTLKNQGAQHAKQFLYVYTRTKNGLSTNQN